MARRRFSRWTYLGILKQQRMMCGCRCGVRMTREEGIEFHHLHDIALGGDDHPDNLIALRKPCHAYETKKGAKARAKIRRIRSTGGLRARKPNAKERYLARKQREMPW